MVVHVDGASVTKDQIKEAAVVRWMIKHPIAAARLILMLMPEGNWDEEEEDGRWDC